MAISTLWGNKAETFILVEFENQAWNYFDFDKAMKKAYSMIADKNHPVDLVFDASKNYWIPGDALAQAKSFIKKAPQNINYVVVVGANVIWERIYRLLVRQAGRDTDKFIITPDPYKAAKIIFRKEATSNEQYATA